MLIDKMVTKCHLKYNESNNSEKIKAYLKAIISKEIDQSPSVTEQ